MVNFNVDLKKQKRSSSQRSKVMDIKTEYFMSQKIYCDNVCNQGKFNIKTTCMEKYQMYILNKTKNTDLSSNGVGLIIM